MSSALSYVPRTYINVENDLILSSKSLRLLGFHFDGTPGVGAHVKQILKKVRYRIWSIHNLKRLRLCPSGLINVYVSLVRPCFDYACVVYSSLLTRSQSDSLERLQRKVLKIIYGFDYSYDQCLSKSGLEMLSVRRTKLCEKFVLKTASNPRFRDWFPLNPPVSYHLRRRKKYSERPTRTKRLRASPIYFYRRLLNYLAEEER